MKLKGWAKNLKTAIFPFVVLVGIVAAAVDVVYDEDDDENDDNSGHGCCVFGGVWMVAALVGVVLVSCT